MHVTLEEALTDEGLSQTVNFGTKGTIEAIKAFMEKRAPSSKAAERTALRHDQRQRRASVG